MIALIFILLLCVVFLLFLWVTKPSIKKRMYKVVKAGSTNCIRPLTVELRDLYNRKFVFEGKAVDPNEYEIFIVSGDSMIIAGIKDGDAVLGRKLFGREKYNLTGSPVLIFEIDNIKGLDTICNQCFDNQFIEFKLRKFISYVEGNRTFEEWFQEVAVLNKEINEKKVIIEEKYKNSFVKNINNGIDNVTLILSSTLDYDKNTISYSFHPIQLLYGIVDYVIDVDKLPK